MAAPRSRGERSFTTSPSSSTSPAVGRSKPAIRFSIVDLPQPLGPISVTKAPVSTARSTSRSTGVARPKALVTPAKRTAGVSWALAIIPSPPPRSARARSIAGRGAPRATTGRVATTEAAAISPKGSSCSPANIAIATGTVRREGEEISVSAKRNSFHEEMKTRTAVVARPGAPRGSKPI